MNWTYSFKAFSLPMEFLRFKNDSSSSSLIKFMIFFVRISYLIFFSNFSPSTMNQNAKIMYVVVHGVTPIFFRFLPTVVFCCAHGEKNLLTVFFLIVERYIVYVLLFYTFFIYKGARIKICCEKKKNS